MLPRIRIATVMMILSFGAASGADAPAPAPAAAAPVAVVQGGCGCSAAPTCGCGPRCDNVWHVRAHCGGWHLLAWHPGHYWHRLTIGSGCANPVSCGCIASERTFLFGGCRQFFQPGHTCGGCGCHYYGPYGYANLGTYENCTFGTYLNR